MNSCVCREREGQGGREAETEEGLEGSGGGCRKAAREVRRLEGVRKAAGPGLAGTGVGGDWGWRGARGLRLRLQ